MDEITLTKPLKKNSTGDKEQLIKKLTEAKESAERAKAELESSYRELQESKDRLVQSEKMAFAGRMAASVAHEIRNPLNMLVLSVQLLQNKISKTNPNRDMVDVIMRNLERIDHLVTELVNCARQPKLKIRNYDINRILNSTIATIREKCRAQKVKIIKNLKIDIPKVRLDKDQIEQAVLNIAKNSIEAMPKRGSITFSTGQDGNYVTISITDTGKGIPEKDIIRIFDPFFTTKKGGTGLGLAICYSIISSHNGFINLRSTKGDTCFTIKLPI